MQSSLLKRLIKAGAVLMVALMPLAAVHAADITVTSTIDIPHPGNEGDGDCSLREAIENASNTDPNNQDLSGGDCGVGNPDETVTDIIYLPAGMMQLDNSVSLASPIRLVGKRMVDGDEGDTVLSGNSFNPVIQINSSAGTIEIKNLQMSNNNGGGGIQVDTATVLIENVRFENNRSTGENGGALWLVGNGESVTVRGSIFISNSGLNGGAIALSRSDASASSSLTISGSSFIGNTTGGQGGAIYYLSRASSSSLTISSSSFSNNTAGGQGGAIYASDNDVGTSGSLNIVNTTFSGNQSGGTGMGITIDSVTATLQHLTIVNNRSVSSATNVAGLAVVGGAAVSLQNSLLSGNQAGGTSWDCYGILIADASAFSVGNLIHNADASCVFGDNLSGDPLLGPLTEGVHPLLRDSAAVDAVACLAGVSTDQRGVARPQIIPGELHDGKDCDAGAYEGMFEAEVMEEVVEEDDDDDKPKPTPTRRKVIVPTATPVRHTCPFLEPAIVVDDVSGSTQCQRLDGGGVGVDSLLAAGVIDAVDVWSWVVMQTQVCFRAGGGGLVFLDAAASPRTLHALPAYRVNGMTCTRIDRPGSVIMVASVPPGLDELVVADASPAAVNTPAPAGKSAAKAPARTTAVQRIGGCDVTTVNFLNIRDAPGGEVIGKVKNNTTLTVLENIDGWLRVSINRRPGWISASYVEPKGGCG